MSNFPEHIHRSIMMEFLAGVRIRRYLENQDALKRNFSKVSRQNGRTYIYANTETINDAVYHQDLAFLDTVDNDCIGIAKLRATPSYKLLMDIESDKLDDLPARIAAVSNTFMSDLSFFKFNGRRGRAYFLTPAHVVSSQQGIMALGNLKADFAAPDSEGRLPLFFLARNAKNRWAIPALCQTFNINANDSGKLPESYAKPQSNDSYDDIDDLGEMNADANMHRAHVMARALRRDLDQNPPPIWDPPVIRAIKYRNLHTLRGLAMLPPGKVNWDIRFQYNHMTPLIYAVLKADEAVKSYDDWKEVVRKRADQNEIIPLEIRASEAAKAVWIVRFIASQTRMNPDLKDATGMDAKEYAFSEQVKNALKQGFDARQARQQLCTTYPSLRFTG